MRTASDAAIYRPDLGMAVMEFEEGESMGMIGQELFPMFSTAKQAASYPVIPKEVMLSVPDVSRAPRGNYNRGDWTYERGTFNTSEKGWEEPIDDTERELFGQEAEGMADLVATRRALGIIHRNAEKRIADKTFNATNFTAHAITHEWDDATNAVPMTDVNDGILAFRLQCGMLPDALVIAYSTFVNLRSSDQIKSLLKYTFPGMDINKMNAAQLAVLFNVPRVLVGGAVYSSAKKGQAAVVADLWSNEYAALVKISSGQNIQSPGLGRTFIWTEDSPTNPIVEQYRDESIRSDIFRVRHHVDEAFIQSFDSSGTVVSNIAAACMYLFSNVTT